MKRTNKLMLSVASLLALGASAKAQWATQQISLTPGWNAVYLEVQPEAPADTVFAGVPIDSAWEWKRIQPPTQFIANATELLPKSAEWATWFPTTHSKRFLADLFQLKGGKPVLLNYTGTAATTLTITGKPMRPQSDWLASGNSLVGLPVDTTGAPTFYSYFANSAAHVGSPANANLPRPFALNASGTWAAVTSSTVAQRGKAYWISTQAPSTYEGPLVVNVESSTGLHFGTSREQAQLSFKNTNTTGNRTVTMTLLASAARPALAVDSPVVAGPVELSYRDLGLTSTAAPQAPWTPITNTALTFTVAPGEEKVVQLAVRRQNFAAPASGSGPDYLYQSLLEIKEGGMRQVVGVTASKDFVTASTGARIAKNTTPATDRSGLWVGQATVNQVSWSGDKSPNIVQANPAFNGTDRTTPRPTPSEFSLKIIMHLDVNGQAKLLQKVVQVWQNGTWIADLKNPGKLLPGTPGRYRLFTDDASATGAGFSGTALRDGKFVARRISSAVFALRQPLALAGTFGSSVSGTVTTGYNDPLNPYVHVFHPQHDNKDALYQNTLPAGIESWDIHRQVSMDFESTNPSGRDNPTWGSNLLGGTYKETITGPHRRAIYVKGTFTLSRVSEVNTLN